MSAATERRGPACSSPSQLGAPGGPEEVRTELVAEAALRACSESAGPLGAICPRQGMDRRRRTTDRQMRDVLPRRPRDFDDRAIIGVDLQPSSGKWIAHLHEDFLFPIGAHVVSPRSHWWLASCGGVFLVLTWRLSG